MSILLDTNILLRSVHRSHPHHQIASDAIEFLILQKRELRLTPKCYTNSGPPLRDQRRENGLGFTTQQVKADMVTFKSLFTLVPDNLGVYVEWERLALQYDVKGKNAHDARLVAAMNVHGIDTLLTFNIMDFTRYPTIRLVDPVNVRSLRNAP